MNTPRDGRFGKLIDIAKQQDNTPDTLFLRGHFKVDRAARQALQGTEQPELVESGTRLLQEAAERAQATGDLERYYRLTTILPFVDLMVYSPVINSDPLTPAQSRYVKQAFDFAGIYHATCTTARDTLAVWDGLREKKGKTDSDHYLQAELVGLLEEQTLLALGMYAATPLEYATPALHYDDAYRREGQRIDATVWDNRMTRANRSRGVQVKHSLIADHVTATSKDILLVEGRDLGNDYASAKWFGNKTYFETLRVLINREFHGIFGPKHSANIERIRRDLFKQAEAPDRQALHERMQLRRHQGSAALTLSA